MSYRTNPVWKLVGLSIVIVALVWLVFGQTLRHQFVNFDDESYVYANPVVSRGLNPGAVGWAFTHIVSHNWHPLTTISHMLDCQLFDLKPGGHHFSNVLLHMIAAILLLIALFPMTGALWRSAFVAAPCRDRCLQSAASGRKPKQRRPRPDFRIEHRVVPKRHTGAKHYSKAGNRFVRLQ